MVAQPPSHHRVLTSIRSRPLCLRRRRVAVRTSWWNYYVAVLLAMVVTLPYYYYFSNDDDDDDTTGVYLLPVLVVAVEAGRGTAATIRNDIVHPSRMTTERRKWKMTAGRSILPTSNKAAIVTFQDHPHHPPVSMQTNDDLTTTTTTTTSSISAAVSSTTKQLSSLLVWGRTKRHRWTSGGPQKSHTSSSSSDIDTNRQNPSSKTIIRVVHSNKAKKTKRTIHPSMLFLEPPEEEEPPPQHPQHNSPSIQDTPRITTRVGTLAQCFATVLTTTTSAENHDTRNAMMIIDMDQLLLACHQFEQAMVDVEQKLSARDLRNNIAKVESLYHSIPSKETKSPSGHPQQQQQQQQQYHSMESILRYEKEQNIHQYDTSVGSEQSASSSLSSAQQQPQQPRLIALNEQSCAMGLLWIRRSLQFQYHLFHSLLQDVDATTATMAAYEQTLQPYHSWALQKIYNMAVKSATPSNQIWLARLGGYDHHEDTNVASTTTSTDAVTPIHPKDAERVTREDLQLLLQIWGPLIQQWEKIYSGLNLEDQRRV